MNKIINTLFPIKLQLTIFQIEEYDLERFIKWVFINFFKRTVEEKRKLILTTKVKLISINYLVFLIISPLIIFINPLIFLACFLILLTQPWIGLLLAALIMIVPESVIKKIIINKTKRKILKLKSDGLKIITITGSYAKTSTKEILYQLLKDKYRVLRTPESYNTALGIAKVVKFELDETYEYFICEMAAYRQGDIKKLCRMIPPDYGAITGITSQHLEKFGSLENIVLAKFELIDFISDHNKILLNKKDKIVSKEAKTRNLTCQNTGNINIKNIKIEDNFTYFSFKWGRDIFKTKTNLFGLSSINNILFAAKIAYMIGISKKVIVSRIPNLKPIKNRNFTRKLGNAILVDNAYSSNPEGFVKTIKTAKLVKGKKVLVTPGLVELGNKEKSIHTKLGQSASSVFDQIVLVGKNSRTINFKRGLKDHKKVKFIPDTRMAYKTEVLKLAKEFDYIFLENDITQNY